MNNLICSIIAYSIFVVTMSGCAEFASLDTDSLLAGMQYLERTSFPQEQNDSNDEVRQTFQPVVAPAHCFTQMVEDPFYGHYKVVEVCQ